MKQIDHCYGENVILLDDLVATTLLAKLCRMETVQPDVNFLVETLYRHLMNAVCSAELEKKHVTIPTRMTAIHPDQHYTGAIIDPDQRAVSVALARAGILPSHVCYSFLNQLLTPNQVRQDHIWAARVTDQKQQVTGADLGGSKIGGDVESSTVFIPDPMGATGSTIESVLKLYKKNHGKARRFVALHLIVTPEYLRNLRKSHPDLKIYGLRVDRGLSPAGVLKSPPGAHWDRERGLNEKQYIVPGAGGLGEVLNNSFV